MKKILSSLHFGAIALISLFAIPATPAQAASPLKYVVNSPPTGIATNTQFGYGVAVEGGIIVVGVASDDPVEQNSGTVKVFDQATGALLYQIPNPEPRLGALFGEAVAKSGTKVVIGARLAGSGKAYVFDLASPTPTIPSVSLENPGAVSAELFGSSVAIDGAKVVVGAPGKTVGLVATGCAYVYDLNGPTPSVPMVVNNPFPAANDKFGTSVSISGTRVVIGCPEDDTVATNAGSVYVFDLASGTPTAPVLSTSAPSNTANDRFGSSVSIHDGLVVVGAPLNDTGATDAGVVYVYNLYGGTPETPIFVFNNPNPVASDSFGVPVVISESRIAVGVQGADFGASGAGAAYVYDLNSSQPSIPVVTVNNPTPALNDLFGRGLALSSSTLVVGAPNDSTLATNAGSIYTFNLAGATPSIPTSTITHPSPSPIDQFGRSVAFSGNRMVVGAPFDDTGATDTGSAYVYDFSSPSPTIPVLVLNNPSPAASDNFGWSVAISGNMVIVGAYQDDTNATNAGSAYVYDLSSPTPSVPVGILNNPNPAANENFGWSVSISGSKIAVGANQDGTGAANAGSVYIYNLNSSAPFVTTVPVVTLNNPAPAAGDFFGYTVAMSGRLLVVGTPNDDTAALNAGIAYLYDLEGPNPASPVATFNNPTPIAQDSFGWSVSIFGNRIIIGAPSDDTGATDAGSAYVYDLSSATPTSPIATLNNPDPAAQDNFGISVAISSDRVVVGAYFDDTSATDSGKVYVYDMGSASPTTPVATLLNPSPASDERFGCAVAASGVNIGVGALFDGQLAFHKGAAYLFDVATLNPTLVSPVSGTVTSSPINVTFTLPEAAASGTVKLGFGATQLTLAASQETEGTHTFTFNPALPFLSPEIASSTSVPDGNYTVTLSYRDALNNLDASAVAPNVTIDTTTLPPVLNTPVGNSTQANPMTVSFSLLEAGQNLRLELIPETGGTPTPAYYSLAASLGTPGAHSFTVDTASPATGGNLLGTTPIYRGVYSVALSYEDTLGNLRAFSPLAQHVTIGGPAYSFVTGLENVTMHGAKVIGYVIPAGEPVNVSIVYNVAGGPEQESAVLTGVTFDGAYAFDLTGLTPGSDYTAAVKTVNSGGTAVSAPISFHTTSREVFASKGAPVPGAGEFGSRIPAGAVWASFGAPSVNNEGQVAVLASYKAGGKTYSGIFTGGPGTVNLQLRVAKGDPAPGLPEAVLGSMKDPVLGPDGAVAWVAMLTNAPRITGAVTSANNVAIFLDPDGAGSAPAMMVARKGAEADGAEPSTVIPSGVAPVPVWGMFDSVSLGGSSLMFTAKLLSKTTGLANSPGPGGVTMATDTGLWAYSRIDEKLRLVVREGAGAFGSTVKSMTALVARPGSPGQGRGVENDGELDYTPVRVILADGRRAIGYAGEDAFTSSGYVSGDAATDYGTGALWQSFGLPTQAAGSTAMAFIGTVKSGTGSATSMNNAAIFAEDDADYIAVKIMATGDSAPGAPGGTFSTLKDPVNALDRSVAFTARLKANKAAGISSTNNDGIWQSDAANGLTLVAREGAQPPDAPSGAQWKAFTSLALPVAGRPMFVATMHSKTGTVSPGPGGVTTANDTGLWATDSNGTLRMLIREGDTIGTSTVKTFTVLANVSGSPAQTRSFNDKGIVLLRVTDIAGAQHLLEVAVP